MYSELRAALGARGASMHSEHLEHLVHSEHVVHALGARGTCTASELVPLQSELVVHALRALGLGELEALDACTWRHSEDLAYAG